MQQVHEPCHVIGDVLLKVMQPRHGVGPVRQIHVDDLNDGPGPLAHDEHPVGQGHGFREIATKAQECRFANCRHTREPDCAVKQAVEDGAISARRYESYKRLLNLTDQLMNRV